MGQQNWHSTKDNKSLGMDIMRTRSETRSVLVAVFLRISTLPLLAEPYDVALEKYTNQCNMVISLHASMSRYKSLVQQWSDDTRFWDANRSALAFKDVLVAVESTTNPPRGLPNWVLDMEEKIREITKGLRQPSSVPPTPRPSPPFGVSYQRIRPLAQSLYMIQASTEGGLPKWALVSDGAIHQLEVTGGLDSITPDVAGKPDGNQTYSNSFDEQAAAIKLILSKMNEGGTASLESLTNSLPTQALLFLAEEGLGKDASSKSNVIGALRAQQDRQIKSMGLDPLKVADLRRFFATDDFRNGFRLNSEKLIHMKASLDGMAPKRRDR